MSSTPSNNPMEFLTSMWSSMGFNLPGMVTPSFDLADLDKKIGDLKTVEGWLRMNLSILQMTIQNLEMQRATVSAMQAMSQMTGQSLQTETTNQPTSTPPWPWNMVQPAPPVDQEEEKQTDTQAKSGKSKKT